MNAHLYDSDSELGRLLIDDLLAIADTKLVLGNWYAVSTHNGKSIPDYAALLAIGAASFGHARALYQYLGSFGLGYSFLERGRTAEGIRSMHLLDQAPKSWPDFIAGTFLAEQATWLLASGFLSHPDRALAGIAKRIGEESYFHLKYASGWARVFGAGDAGQFTDALISRYADAIGWFGTSDIDILYAQGVRQSGFAEIRRSFTDEVVKLLHLAAPSASLPVQSGTAPRETRPGLRQSPLPAKLFEVVRFRDSEAAPE